MRGDGGKPTHPCLIGIDLIAGIINKHKLFHSLSFIRGNRHSRRCSLLNKVEVEKNSVKDKYEIFEVKGKDQGGTIAGVPGLEPRLTEPESAGLPITPYPNIVQISSMTISNIWH